MKKPSCCLETLADDGLTTIHYCRTCAVFHLRIGYTTLHVKPDGLIGLGNAINTSLAKLRRRGEAIARSQAGRELENPLG
ncbi:hypothetical protein [Candidatus Methylocalor cossyra]